MDFLKEVVTGGPQRRSHAEVILRRRGGLERMSRRQS